MSPAIPSRQQNPVPVLPHLINWSPWLQTQPAGSIPLLLQHCLHMVQLLTSRRIWSTLRICLTQWPLMNSVSSRFSMCIFSLMKNLPQWSPDTCEGTFELLLQLYRARNKGQVILVCDVTSIAPQWLWMQFADTSISCHRRCLRFHWRNSTSYGKLLPDSQSISENHGKSLWLTLKWWNCPEKLPVTLTLATQEYWSPSGCARFMNHQFEPWMRS